MSKQRRKKITDEISDLEAEKKLSIDVVSLTESADRTIEEAEMSRGSKAHDLVMKSNAMRRFAREKKASMVEIYKELDELKAKLKEKF